MDIYSVLLYHLYYLTCLVYYVTSKYNLFKKSLNIRMSQLASQTSTNQEWQCGHPPTSCPSCFVAAVV